MSDLKNAMAVLYLRAILSPAMTVNNNTAANNIFRTNDGGHFSNFTYIQDSVT